MTDDPAVSTAGLRLATWNVNSVRARSERLLALLQRSQVDVLAVQETKATTSSFPVAAVEALGYQVAHHGVNQWNGVAVLSRIGLDDVQIDFPDIPSYGDPPAVEARAISAVCGGVRVFSLYVPNGREIDHPHFVYKLDWLAALQRHTRSLLTADPAAAVLLCGDFNIAPTDADVWSTEFFQGHTHVTARERGAFAALLEVGLTDLVRPYTSEPRTFTYWDYRQLRFPKNRGMRIDFLLGSSAVAARVSGAGIDREERKGVGASDHAPVFVDLRE